MNSISLEDTITKAASLKGLSLSEEDKKVIVGMYALQLYKSTLELFLSMLGSKQETHEKVQNLFNSLAASLSPDEQNTFKKVLEEEKARILIEIFSGLNPSDQTANQTP